MKKIVQILKGHKNKICVMMTAGCFALLILSYIYPKYSFITSAYNVMEAPEEERILIPMTAGTQLVYEMTTPNRPLFGIQPLIMNESGEVLPGDLIIRVMNTEEKEIISETIWNLSDLQGEQFVYIPLKDYKKCQGTIQILISYEHDESGLVPVFVANHNMETGSKTIVNGEEMEGSLLSYHVYRKASYPLVYDLQILTLLFAGVSVIGVMKGNAEQKSKKQKKES